MSTNNHLSLRASPGASSGTATPTTGSRTILQTDAGPSQPNATLHLRGASPATSNSTGRRIQWAEDVIDNEGMGKKSSKVCCIYHKPHEPGDSNSSSESDSDSDSEPDLSRAKVGSGKGRVRGRKGNKDGEGDGKGERKPSPNAYERQPKYKGKQKQEG